MDKRVIFVLLVFMTVNLVNANICEDSPTAQVCELNLHTDSTKCETDESFRSRCPCICNQRMDIEVLNENDPDMDEWDFPEDSEIEAWDDCHLDEEWDCEFRYRVDNSICETVENIMQFCPCTCREHGRITLDLQKSIELASQESPLDSAAVDEAADRQNGVVNPALCLDIPDSKLEYDCQFRIASNIRLCDEASYRKQCRCTCAKFGFRVTLEEDLKQDLLTPEDVLPLAPDGINSNEDSVVAVEHDPSRCEDYQTDDHGRGCFLRVSQLQGQPCPDDYREACPCTCRAQDDGELCPDSPWSPMSGLCQVRAANGECSDLKIREDCPCTCALPDAPNHAQPIPSDEAAPEISSPSGPSTGCLDTATVSQCNYYRAYNMCESDFGTQYCKRSCNKCSMEPIPEGDEPVVNLMPDVDHLDNAPESTPEPCEDKAPTRVCERYKTQGLCPIRWVFCKQTCEACSLHYGESEPGTEIELVDEVEEEGDENPDAPMDEVEPDRVIDESVDDGELILESDETQEPVYTGDQEPVLAGDQEPVLTGDQEPVYTGDQEPVYTGDQEPVYTGDQEPADTEYQEPADTGDQEPVNTGYKEQLDTEYKGPEDTEYQEPAATGNQEPADTGDQEPVYTGDQEPALTRYLEPVYTWDQEPVYTVDQERVYTGDQEPVYTGDQEPVYTGDQEPVLTGDQEPVYTGDQEQVYTGDQEPVYTGDQEPVLTGDQEGVYTGHQEPADTGDQEPASTGDLEPVYTWDQEPVYTGDQEPVYTGYQEPADTGDQEPAATEYQEPADTQYQEPALTGDQQRSTGEHTEEVEPDDVVDETEEQLDLDTSRCPECDRFVTEMGCENLDHVVRDYCQQNCQMCLSLGGNVAMEEENNEDEEIDVGLDESIPIDQTINNPGDVQAADDENVDGPMDETLDNGDDLGVPIDNEEILNQGATEQVQLNGGGYIEVDTVVPNQQDDCDDIAEWCEEYMLRGYCEDSHHREDMAVKCRKTCNRC